MDKNEKMMVSIAMLTYNHEKYISQAIESVLAQEMPFTFEIVIGDDCSQDKTREVIMKYANEYPGIFNLIFNTENVGATSNSYNILKNCRGKYIAFLEGDDYWTDSQKLYRQIMFLEKEPDYSGTAHEYKMIDNEGNVYKHRSFHGIYGYKQFRWGLLPGQTGTLCFRNFIQDHKDSYEIVKKASTYIGDRTIVLLMLLHGKVYCFNKSMSVYRVFSSKDAWSNKLGKGNKSINPNYNDMFYYCKLTQYSEEHWNKRVSMLANKAYCVYSALSWYLKDKTEKNKSILKMTYKLYDENKILLFLCCVYLTVRDTLNRQ